MGFFLLTMAVLFGAAVSLPPAPHSFISAILVSAFIARTGIALRKDLIDKKASKIYALQGYIFSGFLLFTVLKNEFHPFYHLLSEISGGASGLASAVTGRPVSMGITYSGLDAVVFFFAAFASAVLIYKAVPLKKCLLYAAFAIILWFLYIVLWTFLAESTHGLRLNLIEPLTGPLDFKALLFAALSFLYLRFLKNIPATVTDMRLSKADFRAPLAFIAACLVIVSVSSFSAHPPTEGAGRVLIMDMGTDFSVPAHEKYGLNDVGMFGVLPHYLSRSGYQCSVASSFDAGKLSETDVLVFINPMYSLDENELDEVWRFVREGGSALALGDHTGHDEIRLPLNAILEPVGLSLNFDSAFPFKNFWAEDFRLRSSPSLNGISGRHVQIVVGASVSKGFRGKTLVIGKEGFSDLGNIENKENGYLGDMHFNRGERIGDLVLAAEASYGRGKFMVFGDTSHFQNTVISYSFPYIDKIFAYLSRGGGGASPQSSQRGETEFFKASCIIDASHLEVFSRDKSGEAVDGLIACALRAGFMPYLNQSQSLTEMISDKPDVKLVVIIEPAKSFTEKEKKALAQFMENGGSLILSAGYASPKASKELAGYFGFAFDNVPLGRVSPDRNPEMAFWNACPVLHDGAYGEKSLMDIWGYDTIVKKAAGQGGLYIIGDPDFLKNKNLESADSFREGNILFLDRVFADILEGGRL